MIKRGGGIIISINYLNLKYFETVAETQHFTKAARELYISQSALSKAINNLEQEIGVPLFERQGRNVRLTSYGRIFRDYVKQSNHIIEDGIHQIQDMANVSTGKIRISSIYSMGANYIPEIIRRYTEKYPGISINYYQKPTTEIIADILDSKTDIGFCGEYPFTEHSSLAFERVLTEEMCLLVRKDHPLADRKSVNFEEVAKETFVGYNKNTGTMNSIYRTLKQAGFTSKIDCAYFATEENTIASMVRSGLGIGMITDIPSIYTEGLVRISIDYPHFYRNLYMVWNSQRYLSPASKNFRNFVLSEQ